MPIDISLLISAPMLQDYLVDKDTGLPLAQGTISMYQDNSRTTFKNWYYQTGTPGNYTYVTLPNPMTLTAVGTMADGNGNDIIPFYYPYSELDNSTPQPYYVVVADSNGEIQFSRQNFPFNPITTPPTIETDTLQNLISNSVFWRNIGTVNATNLLTNALSGLLSTTICPSQHDNFTMPDIQFIKSTNGATDIITFKTFVGNYTDQILSNDITPEYYLNFNCTGIGSETYKYIQIPIQSHVDALSGATGTVTMQMLAVTGSPAITIGIYQFLGTGVTSPAVKIIKSINLTNVWTKYIINFTFPTSQGSSLGVGGDDGYYLQIGLPVGASGVCDINIAQPSIYLGIDVPTDSFQTYDEVNSIISSPRTGDFRVSVNTFQPFGWVPANDGTIGSALSSSTTRANADTWPLYNLIWNTVDNTFAPIVGGKGSSAYSDYSTNKPLTLTRTLGRSFIGANPEFSPITTFTASSVTSILTLATPTVATPGTAVFVSTTGGLPSPLVAETVYFISITSLTSTTVMLSTTLENALAGTNITLTTNSTPTCFIYSATGAYFGTSTTTLAITNMPAHNHPGSTVPFTTDLVGGGATTNIESLSGAGNAALNIASQGSGTPFTSYGPVVYQNIFFKL